MLHAVPPRWRWWHWYSWSNLAVAWYTWNHANHQGKNKDFIESSWCAFLPFTEKKHQMKHTNFIILSPFFIMMNNGEQGLCVDGVQLNWTKLKFDYQRSLSLEKISGVSIGKSFLRHPSNVPNSSPEQTPILPIEGYNYNFFGWVPRKVLRIQIPL